MNRTITAFQNAVLAREVARRYVAAVRLDKSRVKRWMKLRIEDYVDRRTGEANTTELAESAAAEFNLYENTRDYKIPEDVFELAFIVSEETGYGIRMA